MKTSHQSIRGEIVSNWSVNGQERVFEFTIPVGATAIAELPSRADEILTEGGKPMRVFDLNGGFYLIELGSGTYRFETKLK